MAYKQKYISFYPISIYLLIFLFELSHRFIINTYSYNLFNFINFYFINSTILSILWFRISC